VERRSYPPGEHGRKAAMRRKVSDYGMQLREKQKARRMYGVLERQFRRYFEEATRRKGLTGETLLSLLESRLDNVVYRLGFADSRAQARQLVRHGHFTVDGQKTDVPSFLVSPGSVVQVHNSSRSLTYFKERAELLSGANPPTWLRLDVANMSGTLVNEPNREEISVPLREQLIVEYYSR
jgi:small subunit ribosomal protein S4